jgi:hypothetical protein
MAKKDESLLEALDRAAANLVRVRELIEARIAAAEKTAAEQKAES